MPRARTTSKLRPHTRNRRPARNRRRFNVRRLIWPLVTMVVLSGIGAGAYSILTTPKLRITNIEVSGARLLSASAVSADADVALGHNILALSKSRIMKRVMRHPEVKSVRIGRRLPRTVVVRVEERRPAAVVTNGSGMWLVDERGFPFHAVSAAPASIPVLGVPPGTRIISGRKITYSGLVPALECLASSRRMNYRITKISVDQLGNLCLNIGSDFYVRLGQPVQIGEKLETVSRLLEARPQILETGEYLDVSCVGHEAWKPRTKSSAKPVKDGQF